MTTSGPVPNEPPTDPDSEAGSEPRWWRGRRGPLLAVLGLVATSLVIWLAVAQFSGPSGPTAPPGRFGAPPVDSPSSNGGLTGPGVVQEAPEAAAAAAPPVIRPEVRGEAGFAAALAPPGATGVPVVDLDTIGVARQACTALQAGATRAATEQAVMQSSNRDQKAAAAVVTAALANFCPDQARPAATSFGDGTFQAGTDVAPGAYRASVGVGCSWLRSTSPDSANLAGIVESGTGAKTVTIEEGQFFTTSGCSKWAKVP